MSKKPHQSSAAADLRADADALVATWRDLAGRAEARRAEYASWCAQHPLRGDYRLLRSSALMLEHVSRNIPVAEAEQLAARAERVACLALDAVELAEGLDDARLRDLPTLRADVAEREAEITACEKALCDARRRVSARLEDFRKAEIEVSSRRHKGNQPWSSAGFSAAPGVPYMTSIDLAIARGLPTPGHAAIVASLKAEQTKIAFELESIRIEKEAEEKAAEKYRLSEQREAEREWAREHARQKAQRDEIAAEAQRRAELAAAHLARRASGGAA